jgi:hypothetical protein
VQDLRLGSATFVTATDKENAMPMTMLEHGREVLMSDVIQIELDRLEAEYTTGENELLRLRQRVTFLEAALERVNGGMITARKLRQLLQAQETVPAPNGTAPEPVSAP